MQKAPRRTSIEWEEILSNQQKSGQTLKEYGELHQINYHTLIYWRQKLKKGKSQAKPQGFVKLHQPAPPIHKDGIIKLHFDDNIELELPANYQVGDLVDLLKGLSC